MTDVTHERIIFVATSVPMVQLPAVASAPSVPGGHPHKLGVGHLCHVSDTLEVLVSLKTGEEAARGVMAKVCAV